MSPENESLAARLKASAASQAWYEYMLKGGTPRVMSPMDEFAWFETPAPSMVTVNGYDSDWIQVFATNPRRIAVIFANPWEDGYNISLGLSGSTGLGFYAGSSGSIDPTSGLVDVLTQFSVTNIIQGTALSYVNRVSVWPGEAPAPRVEPQGIPIATRGNLQFLQRDFGPLVQGQWYAGGDYLSTLFCVEILLRDFPRQ